LNLEREPACDRQSAADNCVAAHEAEVLVEEMHRAAAAVRDAGGLAEQLSHHDSRISALGEAVAVLAIGRDDVVPVGQRVDRADGDRLLAGIEMTEAGNFAAAVHLGGFLLEAADEGHPAVEVEELALVESQEGVLSGMFIAFERHLKISPAPNSHSGG
jgi:hypothetical protein